jgi:hypothetical protein
MLTLICCGANAHFYNLGNACSNIVKFRIWERKPMGALFWLLILKSEKEPHRGGSLWARFLLFCGWRGFQTFAPMGLKQFCMRVVTKPSPSRKYLRDTAPGWKKLLFHD